jgi:hypothetical protein
MVARRKRLPSRVLEPGLVSVKTIGGKVGLDRYIVRRIKRWSYLYLRRYEGAAGHATPRYRDLYLGAVPPDIVGDPARLAALASSRGRARSLRTKGRSHAKS